MLSNPPATPVVDLDTPARGSAAPAAVHPALVITVAVVAGVAAAMAPPSPTGRPAVDAVLVGVAAGTVTAFAGRAPTFTLVLAACAAAVIAVSPPLVAVAAIALVLVVWAARADDRQVARVVAAGLVVNVLARAQLDAAFGLTSLLAIGACTIVVIAGAQRSSRGVRRLFWLACGALVAFAGVSTVAFALAAYDARHDLSQGLRMGEQGVASLEYGDYEAARSEFEQAAEALDRAHGRLSSPLAFGARLVPIVAQHHDAAVDMSASGASGAHVVAAALDDVDMSRLQFTGGRIDVDAVAALDAPLGEIEVALNDLRETAEQSSSPWLVDRAEYEIGDFRQSVAEHLPQLQRARDAVALAPQLLGADGPRTYLVLFTSPSELRGLGGAVGNVAELVVDDGQLSLHDVARAGESGLQDVTADPDFPSAAAAASERYRQSTGRAVDGVIAVDPYVLAALLEYTGPIQLTTFDQQLDTYNAAWFLIREQYLVADDGEQRIDALDEAAELTTEALLATSLPDPASLARKLGPLAAARRLSVWSPRADEQGLLALVGLDGGLPDPDGREGWAVTFDNVGGNEIDSYLSPAMSYESETDPATGETSALLTVRLSNTAPPEGLPPAVIGNDDGLSPGTNRLDVSVYSTLSLDSATNQGAMLDVTHATELGWNIYEQVVDIPPGGVVTLRFELTGRAEPGDVVTWEQPLTD